MIQLFDWFQHVVNVVNDVVGKQGNKQTNAYESSHIPFICEPFRLDLMMKTSAIFSGFRGDLGTRDCAGLVIVFQFSRTYLFSQCAS